MRRIVLLLLLAACTAASAGPQRIAWLWDRAALPPWSQAQVAVLVQHVLLAGDVVRTRPRMDTPPLRPGTRVTPVVHVQVSVVDPPRPGAEARAAILAAMRRAAALSTSGWVQLDMEARPSQREFYRALVRDLRAELDPRVKLSVTALAWWCAGPGWLEGLAADEVVPMLFRMGAEGERWRRLWSGSPQRLHARCRGEALGSAAQEPLPAAIAARYPKVYVFDRHQWRQEEN